MKADPIIIREIERLQKEWDEELNNSTFYAEGAKKAYHDYTDRFVRWYKDKFTLTASKE